MKTIKYGFTFILLGFISCTKDKGTPVPKVAVTCPSDTIATVSFNLHILPIFNTYCNGAGCHSGTSLAGNLNLAPSVAYSQLTQSGKGYIDTANPNYSVLYSQMNSTSSPMPPTGKLDACTINLVYKWIQQKARNN